MADNVTAEAVVSAGLIFATDDIGGTHFPKTKIVIGADDAQTPLLGGTGVDAAGVIRMSLATDIALPAGTNAIGKLAANSGVDIGDVDVLTYPGPGDAKFATLGQKAKAGSMPVTLASDEDTINIANTALDTVGAGTEAAAQRVTIANDSTGLLSVDDNGGSLTVDNATLDTVGAGTEAAAQRVTIANDSTGLLSVDDNGGSLTVDNATLETVGGGTEAAAQRVTIANDSTGVLSVDDNGGSLTVDNGGTFATQATLQTGSNLAGDFGLSGARTSGGTTFHKNIDVDETEDAVKATAGQVYWIHAINSTAAPVFLKFYNATVATVVVGTTVPDLTFPVPANADSDGAGFTLSIPNGIAFSTAITIAGTLLVADNDATAIGTNALVVNLGFA